MGFDQCCVRCDYLDICGEPEFMERMEAKYHECDGEWFFSGQVLLVG